MKVQRPRLKDIVESDAEVFRAVALCLDTITALPKLSFTCHSNKPSSNTSSLNQIQFTTTHEIKNSDEKQTTTKTKIDCN